MLISVLLSVFHDPMQMTIIVHLQSLSVIMVAVYLAVTGVMVIMTVEMTLMNKNAVRGCVFACIYT